MKRLGAAILFVTLGGAAQAAEPLSVELHRATAEGPGESVGSIQLEEHAHGVLFSPDLNGLEPGLHGFHVHEHPDCGPSTNDQGETVPAGAAGGHYDPEDSGEHLGPWGEGHRGDLPALFVDEQGRATHPVLAPRLSLSELKGRSLMVHAGGDNYSDHPSPLGGGAGRVACGVIEG